MTITSRPSSKKAQLEKEQVWPDSPDFLPLRVCTISSTSNSTWTVLWTCRLPALASIPVACHFCFVIPLYLASCFSLASFQSLSFSRLAMKHPGRDLSVFSLLGTNWASWICPLFSVLLGRFWPWFLHVFSLPFSLLSLWHVCYTSVVVPDVAVWISEALFIFHSLSFLFFTLVTF